MSTPLKRLAPLLARLLAPLALCAAASQTAWSAAPSVDATLEPAQIALGESARLTIMVSGSGTLSVPLPVVSGLEFRVIGQSRQIQITNGITVSSTSTIIRVTPEVTGIFTIPGITPKSPPLVLKVTPDGGGSSNSLAPNPTAPGQGPTLPSGNLPPGIKLTPDGSAFIHWELPKRDIYVGESIPVEIELGIRHGFAAVNGLPTLKSSDFTLNNLSNQPEQFEKNIDGKPFTIVRWRSVLSPIKPGTFNVNIEAPFRVRIRTQPQRESLLDDLLGDPFMQNMFGASVVKDIVGTSPTTEVKVLELPPEGKPTDFSGAVGNFKIASDVSTTTTAAGDPLTLRMHVTGSGNFDRVDSPMLSGDGQWKTYLPKSTFKSGDAVGFKGEKTFEQPLIASHPGTQTIPPLAFSYFDPAAKRYETARTAPLTVTVSPSAADAAVAAAASAGTNAGATAGTTAGTTAGANANATAPGKSPPGAGAPPNALRADHPDDASHATVDSLVPLYLQPRFLSVPSALTLLFAGTWLVLRYRDRRADESRNGGNRRHSKQLDDTLKAMQTAAAAGDATQFFNAARSSLQQAFADEWQMPLEDITRNEVDARLTGPEHKDLRDIFALADEANYSGHKLEATDFKRWTQIVLRRLAHEEAA